MEETTIEVKLRVRGEDPVAILAEALEQLKREGFTPRNIMHSAVILEHAPFVMGGPRGKDKEGWSVTVWGTKPFPIEEAEVSAANSPADPPAGAAPSASCPHGWALSVVCDTCFSEGLAVTEALDS